MIKKSKEPTIKQLEKKLAKNQKDRTFLSDKLDLLKNRVGLPAARKQFEGKYFRYRNSYSSESSWFIYVFCQKVLSVNECRVNRFECDTHGEWNFKAEDKSGLFLLQEEITKEEWTKQVAIFQTAANKIHQFK